MGRSGHDDTTLKTNDLMDELMEFCPHSDTQSSIAMINKENLLSPSTFQRCLRGTENKMSIVECVCTLQLPRLITLFDRLVVVTLFRYTTIVMI